MSKRNDVLEAMNRSLFAVVRQYETFRAEFARAQNVSVTELRAVSRIVEGHSITPKQLASSLELTTGAVTSLVDRLVEAGLVVRQPHPTDRRSLLLAPTASAEALTARIVSDFHELLDRGTAHIDDEQLKSFVALLEGIVARGDEPVAHVR